MAVWVTRARHVGGFRLWLEFNDGVAGEVDLGDRLFGEVFEPLRDPAMFDTACQHPVMRTVAWANGADLAPEFLLNLMRTQRGERAA